MHMKRWFRHITMAPWQVKRAFPSAVLAGIEAAIGACEKKHGGEIRFAVEGALDVAALRAGQTARERAIDVFSHLRIWDTEYNNGVLIYLLLADRDVEIIADRGIHGSVGAGGWEDICREMEAAFRQGDYEKGVLAGIQMVSDHLAKHFPASGRHELPDAPVLL
ncbi:MAG: TPM domain-containing protein [Betaproteobacteria bacterium]